MPGEATLTTEQSSSFFFLPLTTDSIICDVDRIVENFGHVHLSAGDLLREERKKPGSEVRHGKAV